MTGWLVTLTRLALLCAMATAEMYAGPSFVWSTHGLAQYYRKSVQNEYRFLEGIDQTVVLNVARQDAADVGAPLVIFRVDQLTQRMVAASKEEDFVRHSVLTAFTSVVYPYTFVEADEDEEEDASWVGKDAGIKRIVLDESDLTTGDEWKKSLESGGVKEVVVDLDGDFDSMSSALIEQVCEEIQGRSSGSGFVAVLVGKGLWVESKVEGGDGSKVSMRKNAARILQGTNTDLPIRSNPSMLSALLLTLFLLFFLIAILLCVDCVQVPTVFAEKYPPKGKVFT